MKIVFLCRLFYPHIGGVEKHVMEISKLLIKQDHSVTIVTERFEKNLLKKEIVNGITIYRIDTGKGNTFKKFRIWKEMLNLQNIISDADVIHCHDVFFWYLPFRILIPQKPVYITFHGYESYPIKTNAIRMRKISEKLTWGNICIGDFIPKWYGTKPTIISYGGVTLPKNWKLKSIKKDSAVFIGRLDEQTGAQTYAKAVTRLRKKYPQFEFVFVGDGKDRRSLEKKFTVFGFQNNPESYLQNYHYAFVSRYLSILEALAAKRLVIAVYDNPVKKDYLKMAPYAKWIVIAKNEKELSEKILYYMTHPKDEKMLTDKGFAWVKQQTWEVIADLYLQLWKKKL